jgi:hypothetical protein
MEILRQAGLFAILTLLIDFVPLVMAVAYVIRPTEGRLALMRPLSLAGLFAALTGGVLGLLNALRGFGMSAELTPDAYRRMAIGTSESLVSMFVGFGCLTAAWLLVAAGMRRMGMER